MAAAESEAQKRQELLEKIKDSSNGPEHVLCVRVRFVRERKAAQIAPRTHFFFRLLFLHNNIAAPSSTQACSAED